MDLNADVGTSFSITPTSSVTIIDPFECYINTLKSCFDFEALSKFSKKEGFSLLFDGMHGAGGPFAKRVLLDELGLPEVCTNVHETVSVCFSLCHLFSCLAYNSNDNFEKCKKIATNHPKQMKYDDNLQNTTDISHAL